MRQALEGALEIGPGEIISNKQKAAAVLPRNGVRKTVAEVQTGRVDSSPPACVCLSDSVRGFLIHGDYRQAESLDETSRRGS